MLSVYPDNIDEKIANGRDTKLTTDEHLYRSMEYDKLISDEFKRAVSEVAIECKFVQNKFPDHICRVCAPNNKPLYTCDMNANQAIEYDCNRTDPCDLRAKETVQAIVVKFNDSEYYAVEDDNKYGYLIYYKVGDEYEEITSTSPMFQGIIKAIKKS
jgi:hypothetical protein